MAKKKQKPEVKPQKAKAEKNKKPVVQDRPELSQIIRLLNTDLDGRKTILNSLRKVKGISFPMTNIILKKISLSPSTITSDLTDEQISTIEGIVSNPEKHGVPTHMLNVRKSMENNEDKHLTGSDLDIHLRNHIEAVKKLGSYVGMRHRSGKRVRGQRTRSSGRGKNAVGVSRAKLKK